MAKSNKFSSDGERARRLKALARIAMHRSLRHNLSRRGNPASLLDLIGGPVMNAPLPHDFEEINQRVERKNWESFPRTYRFRKHKPDCQKCRQEKQTALDRVLVAAMSAKAVEV